VTYKTLEQKRYKKISIKRSNFTGITKSIDYSKIEKPNIYAFALLVYNSKYAHRMEGLNYDTIRQEFYDYIIKYVDALKILWLFDKNLIDIIDDKYEEDDIELLNIGKVRFPSLEALYSSKRDEAEDLF
jgi:hypothetical protein